MEEEEGGKVMFRHFLWRRRQEKILRTRREIEIHAHKGGCVWCWGSKKVVEMLRSEIGFMLNTLWRWAPKCPIPMGMRTDDSECETVIKRVKASASAVNDTSSAVNDTEV